MSNSLVRRFFVVLRSSTSFFLIVAPIKKAKTDSEVETEEANNSADDKDDVEDKSEADDSTHEDEKEMCRCSNNLITSEK